MQAKTIIRVLLFLSFIFGIGLMNSLKEDQLFSEFENRPLAQFPTFTIERLVDGKFTKEFETYVNDQFISKSFWTGLKAKAEQSLLKKENNGIYFGADDMLFEKPSTISKQLAKNIDSVNQFVQQHENFPLTFVLAPTAIDLYPENLPMFAKTGIHQQIIDEVTRQLDPMIHFVDPFERLKNEKSSSIYFRTDHHWTTYGAFYTYQVVAQEMGFLPYSMTDFNIEQVSNHFFGTFYAKANDLSIKPDSLDKFTLKQPFFYTVKADHKPIVNSLYDVSFLEKRDQYAYFLGGNHAQTIVTSSVNNGRKLLLLKDSYAHAFLPFLANHFEEIHMLDLRYYRAGIQSYIRQHQFTEGLILYNSPNFAADSSILYMKY